MEEVLDAHNIHSVVCFPNPPVRTLALLLRVEDGLCFVGLGGNEGEYPSRDEQDIREFAAKVRVPAITGHIAQFDELQVLPSSTTHWAVQLSACQPTICLSIRPSRGTCASLPREHDACPDFPPADLCIQHLLV